MLEKRKVIILEKHIMWGTITRHSLNKYNPLKTEEHGSIQKRGEKVTMSGI